MEIVILIQAFLASLILAIIAYWLADSRWSHPRKWAKVRLLVDEKRRRRAAEPVEEEDFEAHITLQWFVIGGIMLLILFLGLGFYAG